MYELYYNNLKKYNPDLNVLSMNTDSYLVECKRDPYEIIKENSNEFKIGDYSKNYECYNIKNN